MRLDYLPSIAITAGRGGRNGSAWRDSAKRRAYRPHVLGMAGAESQFDDRSGIRRDFGLPSVVRLIADHGLLCARVPLAGGRAVKIFFADQRRLDFGSAIVSDFLLAMAFPCAAPWALGRSLLGRLGLASGRRVRRMLGGASFGRAQAGRKKENYADV